MRRILDILRDATAPMTSQEVAQSVLSLTDNNARDRRLMTAHMRWVSKALRSLKLDGTVGSAADVRGNLMWLVSSKKV